MPFDWNDYYTLALELANSNDEAKMRSAISRSYYCAFHIARNYVRNIRAGYKYDGHDHLWNQFGTTDKNIIQSWGERIRKIRNDADYEDNIKNLRIDLRTTMAFVKSIVDEINKPSV